jgi:hypothetical protein
MIRRQSLDIKVLHLKGCYGVLPGGPQTSCAPTVRAAHCRMIANEVRLIGQPLLEWLFYQAEVKVTVCIMSGF